MSRRNPAPPRFDRMGNSQDEEQRPTKRIRLDKPDDAGQAPPPPPALESQNEVGFPLPPATAGAWRREDALHHAWMFPNEAFVNGSLPHTNFGHVACIGPDPSDPMLAHMEASMPHPMVPPMPALMAPPMAPPPNTDYMPSHMATHMPGPPPVPVSLPIGNPMPTFDTSFNAVPNPADISAAFPPPLQHVVFPVQDSILPPQLSPQPQQPAQQLPQPQPAQQLSQPQPAQQLPQPQPAQQLRQPQLAQNAIVVVTVPHQEQRRRKSRVKYTYTSPFTDCIDSFGSSFVLKHFDRPTDGRVNGYIKFSWPQKSRTEAQQVVELTEIDEDEDEDELATGVVHHARQSTAGNQLSNQSRAVTSPSVASAVSVTSISGSPHSTSSTFTVSSHNGSFVFVSIENSMPVFGNSNTGTPHFIPPHFGYMAIMDDMDRKLFKFYLNNWCPGRSVLKETNLWLTDFAKMHDSTGVLAAIQSLAGIYIHDYLPDEIVRRRVNERFAIAETRLCELLQQQGALSSRDQSELITLASLLSMQDIVLTERRLKKPYQPRWLTGFKQAEQVLHNTDPGNRFYNDANVQVDALRLSQTIIVGRAVILAQPMMVLPNPATFHTITEASRFGFLLYGSERDMFQIHGGCGFSKRLLHIFSQVTFCAARMMQDPETPIIPLTAQSLYISVRELRQWSTENTHWDQVRNEEQPVQWIRRVSESYVIQTAAEMTDVTAEAWRLAGMIYLQCRLLRLPRNHPDVVSNIADLAKSISIMPTSGSVFTAQAPLLPVFFLGLLATEEDHIEVATAWFQQVIYTPVRSSVPPLYEALERIQSWMPTEIPLRSPNSILPPIIAERQPWWEHMVSKVQDLEGEVLCLT